MPLVLAIETAGSNCSAAVAVGGAVLAAECRAMRHGHAEALLPMVGRVMRAAGATPRRLDCVAAAIGPGGFTGIRVGLAAAQGIARGTGARLVGVTGFAAVAVSLAKAAAGSGRALMVALDSRREDFYVQLFAAADMTPLAAPHAVLPGSLADHVGSILGSDGESGNLLVAGDAAAAAAAALGPLIGHELAAEFVPDARGVAAAALRRLAAGGPDEAPRPLYLRPPDVTLPRLPAVPPRW